MGIMNWIGLERFSVPNYFLQIFSLNRNKCDVNSNTSVAHAHVIYVYRKTDRSLRKKNISNHKKLFRGWSFLVSLWTMSHYSMSLKNNSKVWKYKYISSTQTIYHISATLLSQSIKSRKIARGCCENFSASCGFI